MQNTECLRLLAALESEIGWPTGNSVQSGADQLLRLAESGNPEAMVRLALFVEDHPDALGAIHSAIDWYRRASIAGHPRGHYNTGRLQYQAENYKEAVANFTRAVLLGDRTSFVYLGLCYENGHCVNRSVETAFRYYRIAALLGERDGALRLSSLAEEHELTTYQLDWTFHCLSVYIGRNVPTTAYAYARLLILDREPTKPSQFSAVELMHRAADGGVMEARIWLDEHSNSN